MFRDRFWITLLLTIPTLVWSEMIQRWLDLGIDKVFAEVLPGDKVHKIKELSGSSRSVAQLSQDGPEPLVGRGL